MMNSDTGGIIIRIIIGKVSGIKIINKQAFMLTSKQLVMMVLLMTLKSNLLIIRIPVTPIDVSIRDRYC